MTEKLHSEDAEALREHATSSGQFLRGNLLTAARGLLLEADSHARDLARESSGREKIARRRAGLLIEAAFVISGEGKAP